MRHLLFRLRHRSQCDLYVIHSNLASVQLSISEADLEAACGVLSDLDTIFERCIPHTLNDLVCLEKSPNVKNRTVIVVIIDQVDVEARILVGDTLRIRLK